MAERPTCDYRPLEMALTLMRAALPLLDAADEKSAAALLQHSISEASREPVLVVAE